MVKGMGQAGSKKAGLSERHRHPRQAQCTEKQQLPYSLAGLSSEGVLQQQTPESIQFSRSTVHIIGELCRGGHKCSQCIHEPAHTTDGIIASQRYTHANILLENQQALHS